MYFDFVEKILFSRPTYTYSC